MIKNKIIGGIIIGVLATAIFIFSNYLISEDSYFYNNHFEENYSEQENLVSQEEISNEITLLFGGDIMLSRTVNAKMLAYNDYAWPLRLIAPTISAADLSIFNLESPFLENSNYHVPSGSFSFRANPLAVEALKIAGVDLVSLANNHTLNASKQGIIDTKKILAEQGIFSVGAGLNEEEAREGVLIERNDWKVVFLAYAYPRDYSVAKSTRPGINTMNKENLQEDIKGWREKADLIIVLMHAGEEYTSVPNQEQIDFARAAIDYGADAVIGHHPHWPQSWEVYKNRPIFYSLGNFVFDQMWSKETSQGILAELKFDKSLSGSAKLIPIVIKDYGQVDLWPLDEDERNFWSLYNLEYFGQIIW